MKIYSVVNRDVTHILRSVNAIEASPHMDYILFQLGASGLQMMGGRSAVIKEQKKENYGSSGTRIYSVCVCQALRYHHILLS